MRAFHVYALAAAAAADAASASAAAAAAAAAAAEVASPPRLIFGLGVYNDTPGSPSLSAQLPVVANLTSGAPAGAPGAWVLLLLNSFSAIGPPDAGRVNLSPLPYEVAALRQAYALGLRVILRIGNNAYTRYASDDEQHQSYKVIAAAYRAYVAQLPLPPDGSPLRVTVGNELNECDGWGCKEGLGLYGDVLSLFAAEAAAFIRDVHAALRDLPGLRLMAAPVASQGPAFCECRWAAGSFGLLNGTAFIARMLEAVPDLYATADDFGSHPYPACQEPFEEPCAGGWLADYKAQYALALHSWGGAARGRFPIFISETGWQSPKNETEKAQWMCDAYTKLWLPDPLVDGVTPFLTAGQLWQPAGWPWAVFSDDGAGDVLLDVQPQYRAVQALAARGNATRRA